MGGRTAQVESGDDGGRTYLYSQCSRISPLGFGRIDLSHLFWFINITYVKTIEIMLCVSFVAWFSRNHSILYNEKNVKHVVDQSYSC